MKIKFLLAAAVATVLSASAQAQVTYNVTGATAFRTATINAIIASYGGLGNVGVVTSVASGSVTGSSAISFRGNFGSLGDTIIRCRFSGSTEGIRDLVGTTIPGTPNDVPYYADSEIPAVGLITYKNEQSNPVTANVPFKPDVAFSDVQQNSSPYRSPVLGPADSRVGVVTFVFAKSQGSHAGLTNVTSQAWRALLASNRGVPLSTFTGLAADATPARVLATGRNDGSGTRAVYLIEPQVGVSRLVNQFKSSANGFNSFTLGAGFTGDVQNFVSLWPSNDAEDVNNNSILWNPLTNGNGGYFSGSNVSSLLQRDTSSIRVMNPTGNGELSTSGSYVSTATTGPRQFSIISCIGTNDGVNVISGGGAVLSYEGTLITPVATGVDPTGLVPADRFKVTNGQYTLWSYERLFNRGTLNANQLTIDNTLRTNIPGSLANSGVPLTAMIATRINDGDTVTVP